MNPRVMLLDEPTRGIDVGAKAEVQSLIEELARDGLGVLLISSEMEELVEGSDRVVVLRDGRVTGHLDGAEVTEAELMRALAAETPGSGPETAGGGTPADAASGTATPAKADPDHDRDHEPGAGTAAAPDPAGAAPAPYGAEAPHPAPTAQEDDR
jgi:ribose transport system ATP-binding protein